MEMPRKLWPGWFLLALALYMALLVTASLMPIREGSVLAGTPLRRTVNNLLHVPAYAVLSGIWIAAVQAFVRRRHRIRCYLLGAGLATAFGGLMELAQAFVPTRTASVGDFCLNAVGSFGMAALALWVTRRRAAQPST
jgi:VanZ family protein